MARLRAEVKNLHLPGCPDPNAEKYQALSLAVEKLPPVEQLLAQWLPDAAGRYLVLCEDDAAAAQTAEQAEKRCLVQGEPVRCISSDAEALRPMKADALRLLVWCQQARRCRRLWPGSQAWCLVRRTAGHGRIPADAGPRPLRPAAVCRWQS